MFKIVWTGCMEPDENDFLLYHEDWNLLEWNIQEIEERPGLHRSLSADDCAQKPEFDFYYILSEGNHIHFDFFVHGFSVPQSDFPHRFDLVLAATEESPLWVSPIMNYNACIRKGSNRIFLNRHRILDESAQKAFEWSWASQRWHPQNNTAVYFSHYHHAKVKLSITSHYSK